MSESLGKSVLDLDADLRPFVRQVKSAEKAADEIRRALEALAAVANLAEREAQHVRLQAAESEAREAARHLEVKLDQAQTTETAVAADRIERNLKGVTGEANEARGARESVRLVGGVPGRSGVGVGAFGSGYGRIGLLGTAIPGTNPEAAAIASRTRAERVNEQAAA